MDKTNASDPATADIDLLASLPSHILLRRSRRALRRMTRRERAIFLAVRDEQSGYREIAARLDLTPGEVEAAFASAMRIFVRSLGEESRWWQIF